MEKALKFATKSDREVIDELNVDRNNMLLFPTIASCSSSEHEEKEENEEKEEPKKKHHHHHHHHHHHSFPLCNKHTMSAPPHRYRESEPCAQTARSAHCPSWQPSSRPST